MSQSPHSTLPSDLEYVATVDVSCLPLYLAVGPSFRVYSTSETSRDWFDAVLTSTSTLSASIEDDNKSLEDPPTWTLSSIAHAQSTLGILTRPKSPSAEAWHTHRITELLFYAAHLPGSSHPALLAQPYSSDLLSRLPHTTTPPLSRSVSPGTEPPDVAPQFLPAVADDDALLASKKRKHLADVFDSATAQRRKARRTITEAVRVGGAHPGAAELRRRSVMALGRADGGHGRSLSQCSVPVMSPQKRGTDRDGGGAEGQAVEGRNKELISRVVMTGLRLYGYERPVKRKAGEQIEETKPMVDEEEYKGLYHQVYKGTVFALVSVDFMVNRTGLTLCSVVISRGYRYTRIRRPFGIQWISCWQSSAMSPRG